MTCLAKIRPFPDPTELQCEKEDVNHRIHEAVLRNYAYEGSETKIEWDEQDRRTFRGEWKSCEVLNCILPKGHRGNHAS